jgi:hypothetical protein
VTTLLLPNHESLAVHRHCTDYLANLDMGELAPGTRLIVHGVCLDSEQLWLYYAWTPGITSAMGEASGVWLTVEYHADVPPDDGSCAGAYDTSGSASSEGEIGYARPPQEARRVWFDFFATNDDRSEHRISRLRVDLRSGQVTARK